MAIQEAMRNKMITSEGVRKKSAHCHPSPLLSVGSNLYFSMLINVLCFAGPKLQSSLKGHCIIVYPLYPMFISTPVWHQTYQIIPCVQRGGIFVRTVYIDS